MRWASRGRGRGLAFVAVGALAAALGLIGYATDALRRLELDTVDARFSIRGAQAPPHDIVVVEIDDASFDQLNQRWPFPRSLHGRLVRRLHAAGAKTIAYDVQFTEPTSPREDNALIRAVAAARGVVLSTTEVNRRGESKVFGGEEVLRQIGARAANTLSDPDPGGVLRRVPYQVGGLESFAVAAVEVDSGRQVDAGEFDEGEGWIDFRGPPGTFETVSFSRVLRGAVSASRFRGKTVVVGVSAPTIQDVHPTPMGDGLMSGAEVQANAIFTVERALPLGSSPWALNTAVIVLMAMLAPAASMRLSPIPMLALALLFAGAYLVAAQVAFNAGLIISVVYPLVALALAAVGALAIHYTLAAFERQRVRDTFARFVPEQVVDQVLARTDADLRLGGVRREGTVLFSDLRGFTSFAEALAPGDLIEVLNRYLSEMSDAIMDHGGTLVAYMGDGIMAVFGAPLEQPDHADRALGAAREMMGPRLQGFNAWLRDGGLGEGFRMGIGLNSGAVMSGQVGSERRVEYTAVGDTTNTASRLEGMTKGTRHQLFLADSVRTLLRDEPSDLVPVGEVEIRGRDRRLKVWSLAEPGDGEGSPSATTEVESAI